MAIVLGVDAVRLSAAKLMAWRLRAGGFAQGRGGTETADFTADTTPSLATATDVVTRNAALVSDDFPLADETDEPELRTIAALRSAIELELGVPQPDYERVREWRLEIREHVGRVADLAPPDEAGPGGRVLDAEWYFGPLAAPHVEGAEFPVTTSRRLRW